MNLSTHPKGRYAHVYPGKQECHLRGIPLGTIEHPGKLPMSERLPQSVARRTNAELRAMVLDALRAGVNTMSRIKAIAGYPDRTEAVMAGMIEAGEIVRMFKGKKALYEVAK